MSNPFDEPEGAFVVLRNGEGQHSLWPADFAVPAGWTAVHGPSPKRDCLDHVTAAWPDLRPASLVRGS